MLDTNSHDLHDRTQPSLPTEQLPAPPLRTQAIPASLEIRRPAQDAGLAQPVSHTELATPTLDAQLGDISLTTNDVSPLALSSESRLPTSASHRSLPFDLAYGAELGVSDARSMPTPMTHRVTEDTTEHVSYVYHECQLAKSNASVFTETLSFEGLHSALVDEFLAKVQGSQDTLLSELAWTSEYAESPHTSDEVAAGAEALLADVLETLSTLGEALNLYGRMREAQETQRQSPTLHDAPAPDDDSETLHDLIRPSEKALGKRRAIEDDGDEGASVPAVGSVPTSSAPAPALTEKTCSRGPTPSATAQGDTRPPKPPLPAVPVTAGNMGGQS
ncbi:hypothetical protein MBRA1_000876 [Malassezia brasiliensis]|uniref:Uncharacterized protein n=1 Tax=Malassezia brasiliensis TaxID=1821822 RepID=A0AAF0DR54_9BASI|nr:hypothetical protein MBRA1_000876 [Malassezia brasiliensis]